MTSPGIVMPNIKDDAIQCTVVDGIHIFILMQIEYIFLLAVSLLSQVNLFVHDIAGVGGSNTHGNLI